MNQDFKISGKIIDTQIIATGRHIRELATLQKRFGRGRWRKLKGVATVSLTNGTIRLAEVHWYGRTESAKCE